MDLPRIRKIRIHPIKSLDPIELEEAQIGVHSLLHDRQFAIVADDDRYINGKRTGRVNQLKTSYNFAEGLVTFSERSGSETHTFPLQRNHQGLKDYLSAFFGMNARLVESHDGELMDIPQASSVTVVSSASLQSLNQDFPSHSLDDLRLRFRTNIEIDGVEAFWEERLFDDPGVGVRFKLGDVELIGVSPRARCNVPPKDPFTGELNNQFAKTMIASRASTLPRYSKLPLHGNMYQLTVNVFVPKDQQGKRLRINDSLEILGTVSLQ